MGEELIAPGRYVITGTVEKDGRFDLLIDLGSKERKISKACLKSSYICDGEKRNIYMVPVVIDDYAGYTKASQKRIKAVKRSRNKGKSSGKYVFSNGEKVSLALKKSVIGNFASGEKIHDFISLVSSSASATKNARNVVTEESVWKFFSGDKDSIFSGLDRIRKELYSNDKEWARFLSDRKISICVIMPTYNESNFERNVQMVHRLKESGIIGEVIITDGFSSRHEPVKILKKLRKEGKSIDIPVIRQGGCGKGEAIEAAVKYAHAEGYDFSIILDSDNMPALSRIYKNAPVDIDIEFFARSFCREIISSVKKLGLTKTKKTFFKASYMRMPQLKKSLDFRFGIVTKIMRDFYKRALNSHHNLYPLSGEVAFSPGHLLEDMSLLGRSQKLLGVRKSQYCGSNVPGGFCLETFWNSVIDILGYDVSYVNTMLHHHGPVIKSTKTDIGEQIGEVLTGTFAGMLVALLRKGVKKKEASSLLKKIPSDVIRPDRIVIEIQGNVISPSDII